MNPGLVFNWNFSVYSRLYIYTNFAHSRPFEVAAKVKANKKVCNQRFGVAASGLKLFTVKTHS